MNTYVPPFQHYVHCVSNDVAVWIWKRVSTLAETDSLLTVTASEDCVEWNIMI
jgi:hypothetical protein